MKSQIVPKYILIFSYGFYLSTTIYIKGGKQSLQYNSYYFVFYLQRLSSCLVVRARAFFAYPQHIQSQRQNIDMMNVVIKKMRTSKTKHIQQSRRVSERSYFFRITMLEHDMRIECTYSLSYSKPTIFKSVYFRLFLLFNAVSVL